MYFGRRLPIAHGFCGGRAVRVTTCTFRISVCLLLSIGSTTATPTITNGIIYEFEHEPELFRKPLRCIRTLVTFSEYRDKSWDLGDLATFWNFIMIRLELKMHNDAHGLHNNTGPTTVNVCRYSSNLSRILRIARRNDRLHGTLRV